MKLEIRKVTNPDGNIYIRVCKDDFVEQSFWVGNPLTNEQGKGEEKALSLANDLYERLKINSTPIVEIIQSETIETTTHEPAQ